MKREEVYDAEIAPLMTQIIAIAKKHDIPMHALFKLDDGDYCETHLGDNSAQMRLLHYLSMAGENFDAFMIAAIKDARIHGHTSAYITLLDTAAAPVQAAQGKGDA